MTLISFEGLNGSGRTTQIKYLHDWYTKQAIPVTLTKEPKTLGGFIRSLLVQKTRLHPLTKLLLFMADRNENVITVIRPALERGEIVICDRYIDNPRNHFLARH
jgi:dTMP kinase